MNERQTCISKLALFTIFRQKLEKCIYFFIFAEAYNNVHYSLLRKTEHSITVPDKKKYSLSNFSKSMICGQSDIVPTQD